MLDHYEHTLARRRKAVLSPLLTYTQVIKLVLTPHGWGGQGALGLRQHKLTDDELKQLGWVLDAGVWSYDDTGAAVTTTPTARA